MNSIEIPNNKVILPSVVCEQEKKQFSKAEKKYKKNVLFVNRSIYNEFFTNSLTLYGI